MVFRSNSGYDLGNFSLSEMTECGVDLRGAAHGAASLEEAAGCVVSRLRESFTNPATGAPSFVMARFFAVLPFATLEPQLQQQVSTILSMKPVSGVLDCLTLLSAAGDVPKASAQRVIPLVDDLLSTRAPMLSRLLDRIGWPSGNAADPARQPSEVLFVPDPAVARDTACPLPPGIRSMLGFGGMLYCGRVFAVALFSQDPVSARTAELFKSLALSVRLAVLPFAAGPFFASTAAPDSLAADSQHLRFRIEALEQLIEVQDKTVLSQSRNLERLDAAVESTDDTVFITSLDGTIEYANPAFERTTGYSREEALGQTPRILKSGMQDDAYYRALWDRILKGNVHRGIAINRRKNGQIFYAEQTITPVRGAGGRLTHFVSIIKDITERRKLLAQEIEMKLAAQVQKKLYPGQAPGWPGYDVASVVLPAKSTCGDCFDFIAPRPGATDIIIGDVSGHGLGSALVMSETRAYLRALARGEDDPGRLLTRTNEMLAADLLQERYVTLLIAQLEIESRVLVYANAGHPAGYVLDRSGAIRAKMEACGPPVGVFPESIYASSRKLALEPGDIMVLITDGVTETEAADGGVFGVERVLQIVRAHRHRTAGAIVDEIQQALRRFAQPLPQYDDVTIVLVKVNMDAAP